MHDNDFNALLETGKLEQALAVEEYVTEFKGEVRARFDRTLREAMEETAKELPKGWTLEVDEEWYAFHAPHIPWLVKHDVYVSATWDDKDEEEDVRYMQPFVCLFTPEKIPTRARTRLWETVEEVIPHAGQSDHCPAWARPRGYEATTLAEELRAISGESGRVMAEDMAETALALVRALDLARWPRA